MTLFERLDLARRVQNHTIEDAVEILGVHRQSWFKWRGGTPPSKTSIAKIKKYIKRGQRKMKALDF